MRLLCRASRRNLTFNRIVVLAIIGTVIYNEYISHILCSLFWNRPHLQSSSDGLQIMFVADPQLVGLQDEVAVLGYFTRWDCDRYLQHTFSMAYSYIEPDVVVFMGDLIDEGSKATKPQYLTYVQRFNNIFKTKSETKLIYIPGDNDIGGEGADLVEAWKIHRFDHHFQDSIDGASYKQAQILKLDPALLSRPEGLAEAVANGQMNSGTTFHNKVNLLLSHEGVVIRYTELLQTVLKATKPHIIVSAHTHIFRLFTCDTCYPEDSSREPRKDTTVLTGDNSVHHLSLYRDKDRTYEVVVPTCSYRMGVPDMGYTVATIDGESGEFAFSTLWLPSRYSQLFIYACCLALICAMFVLHGCLMICACIRRRLQYYYKNPIII